MSPTIQAMALILASQLSTAFQNVAIRLAADDGIHPFQIAWVRGVVGFVMVVAFLVFGERPDRRVWLGAAVIFGSTLYIAHRAAAEKTA